MLAYAACWLLTLPLVLAATPETAPRGTDDRESTGTAFESFRLITARNIFDASRRQDVREPGRAAPAPPVVRSEYVALIGTFIYEIGGREEVVAFFSGSDAGNSKAVRAGESLTGYRVAAVRTDGVTLEGGEAPVELPVGGGLRRRGDEPWQIASAADILPGPAPSPVTRTDDTQATATAAGAPPPGAPPAASGAADDVLKKLMERRRQETGR